MSIQSQGKNFLFFAILLILGSYAGGFVTGFITPYVGNSTIAWIIGLAIPPFLVWMLIRKFGKKTVT